MKNNTLPLIVTAFTLLMMSHAKANQSSSVEAGDFLTCSRQQIERLLVSEMDSLEVAKNVFITCREYLPSDIRYFEHYEETIVPQLVETVEQLRKASPPSSQ
jgi:hypothetical protein